MNAGPRSVLLVDDEPERDALVEIGCDLLQGFLFARPGRGFVSPSW